MTRISRSARALFAAAGDSGSACARGRAIVTTIAGACTLAISSCGGAERGRAAASAVDSAGVRIVSTRLGTQLEPGMELVYASDGSPQPPWTIDSLIRDVPFVRGSECVVIHMRRRPDQPDADENRLCRGADTLYQWDVRDSAWTIIRPVGPHMVWTARRANGDTVRYETGALSEESIAGRMIPVVQTTVTTTDSLGRPKRRLRERYSVTLATATGGVFESPDSIAEGRWVTVSVFELREIRVR